MAMSSLVTEREEACTGCRRKVPYWNAWTTGISSPLKLRRCIRDGKHVFVPDYARGIGVLEVAKKQVRWLSMQQRFAINGIDGLYFDHGKLIAVQNGTSPERVVVFTLDATLTRIESETIIERSTGTLGDPTHGVVIDNTFYYIANSGWDSIDDHGNMKPGAKPSVPRKCAYGFNGFNLRS
jgi:hypothetical protein